MSDRSFNHILVNNRIATVFFPGQLAFCKKAVEGLAARRIFWIVQWSRVVWSDVKKNLLSHTCFVYQQYGHTGTRTELRLRPGKFSHVIVAW